MKNKLLAIAVIFASCFVGLGQTLFQIHSSDFSDLEAPFLSPLASALTAPLFAVLIPAVLLSVLFLVLELVNRKLSRALIDSIVSLSLLLFCFRVYYLSTETYILSVLVVALAFTIIYLAVAFFRKYIHKVYVAYAVIALILTVNFFLSYHSYLNRTQYITEAYAKSEVGSMETPLFIFVFDELSSYLLRGSDGEIDGETFPELKEFANRASWFPNATTPHSSTITTLASVVSGQDVLEVCSDNGSKEINKVVKSIFSKKCGTNHIFTHPELAGRVNVAGSKFGVSQIKLAAKQKEIKESAKARLGDTSSQQVDLNSRELRRYLQDLVRIYAEGTMSPAWASKVFGWLLNAEVFEKRLAPKKDLEQVRRKVLKEELFKAINVKSGEGLKGDIKHFSFIRCVRKVQAMVDEFERFIDNIDPVAYPINALLTDLTHISFCWDAQGPVELVHPRRAITKPDGSITFVPDGMAIYNRAQSMCGFDEVSYNVKRSRINQSRLALKLFGKAIAKIKEAGVFDQSLIVVMSDHGRGFLGPSAGRRNMHYRSPQDKKDNAMMNAAMALLIKFPGQESGIKDLRLVRPMDVGATIVDALDLNVPWSVQGQSLLSSDWQEPDLPLPFVQTMYSEDSHKLIRSTIEAPDSYFEGLRQRIDLVEPLSSSWIGRKVSELPLAQGKLGSIEYVKIEHALRSDGPVDNVLVVGGHSGVQVGKTLIAINGTIAKAIKPCLVFKGSHHPQGSVPGGWVATIPASQIHSGRLDVRAFSQFEDTTSSFYEYEGRMTFTLSPDQLKRLKVSS